MRRGIWTLALVLYLFLPLVIALPPAGAQGGSEGDIIEIRITAEQFHFGPERITVRQGDVVRLIITSADVTHGFYLDGYGINEEIVPGEEVVVEFTASTVGKFAYRCSVTCGTYHPYMKGELVVEGQYGNYAFLGASVLTVGLAGGAVYYFHRRTPDDEPGSD